MICWRQSVLVFTASFAFNLTTLNSQIQNFPDIKPSPQQIEWQDLEFGVIIHFGPNTFLDRAQNRKSAVYMEHALQLLGTCWPRPACLIPCLCLDKASRTWSGLLLISMYSCHSRN
jgi:hypothetical protein